MCLHVASALKKEQNCPIQLSEAFWKSILWTGNEDEGSMAFCLDDLQKLDDGDDDDDNDDDDDDDDDGGGDDQWYINPRDKAVPLYTWPLSSPPVSHTTSTTGTRRTQCDCVAH
ncbi:ATPase family AAA domain-containing protein 2-like isoform X2 [Alosa sapidissima]|uniref:ATPase family AAA domain-containing protein 2-like isoform X2 n=1 Tax=Alosa sapidissima TaxID=34773 RepID=UPI001C09EAA8|nr:ATPase family AAA domain-containing protein 2-like isoform X2 [Alosa sapidissima]